MRETKFRAWLPEEKIMAPVFGIEWGDDGLHESCVIHVPAHSPKFKNYQAVPPAVLMQNTGLKDKNGKEIYEGDFIRVDGNIFLMDWVDGRQWLLTAKTKNGNREIYWRNLKDWEIVGNVYENQSLEVEQDFVPKWEI